MKKAKPRRSFLGRFRSIESGIFLIMGVMVLLTISTVIGISLRYTKTSIYDNTVTYTKKLTSQMNYNIDQYINYMENISSMVAEDSDVQTFLFGNSMDSWEAGKKLWTQFSTVLNSRSDIYNIGILQAGGKTLLNEGNEYLNMYVDVEKLDWYQDALKHPDSICLSSAHVQHVVSGERPWVITLSRYLPNTDREKPGGVLFVDLNYSAIRKLCEESSLEDDGYIFILDGGGNIVYHPQQQQLYNELQTEHIDEVLGCKNDYLELGEGSQKRLYTLSKSEKTGWMVVSCAYTSELLKNSQRAQRIYVLVAVILVILAVIVANLVARSITWPIQKLKSSMALVQEGDFQAGHVEDDSKNEIGSLTKTFNVMTQRIQELMEANVQEQKAKRKSELKALQSQINPHFLYNTLDSIIWMAEGKKNEEVVLMTASLARLLRQNIGNDDEEISIAQEMEYCRNYLTIQKMRYKDKLEFEVESDPEIAYDKIIKLVLQPLIENAIYHGIKYKDYVDEKGFLSVKAFCDEDEIWFEIRDNGVGMDEEKLEHIFDKHIVNYHSNGVGVYNVQKRLQLTYGQKYGISYQSVLGKGTVTTIRIPRTDQ